MSKPPLSHPSHDHPLMLLHVTKASNQVHCSLCDERITGPAYSCHACAAYLHRECAEAPIRILRHPFHPHHPLHQFDSHLQYCSICNSVQYGGYMYRCQECRFFLGFICATATLPPDHDQETREVEYAAHEHPLTPLLARHPLPVCCVLCKVEVEGEVYFCSDCRFFLHKKCFALPLEIQHPLHAQHPIFPIVRYVSSNNHAPSSRGDNCDACNASCLSANCNYFEKSSPGTYLVFGCLKCEFYLDITCAVNIVPPTNQERNVIAHQHELSNFCVEEENSIPINCGICKLKIVGESSGCTTCRFFFHANCVKGPTSLEYPVHSEHPLTLTLHPKEGRCRSCDCSLHPLIYGCECGFNVHSDCALQAVNYHEQGQNDEIWMPWHEHRLVLCHRRAQENDVCNACGDLVEGLGYICSNILCGLLLHKLCTRLTSQLLHPHHPHHPLILVPEALGNKHPCDACLRDIRCFSFSCSKCSFNLDTKCASRLPEQKHQLHHHKLVYFQKIPSLTCYVCCQKSDSAIFRCVYCDFNLHEVCMKLPLTVKSDKHLHELKLWDSYVDDDSGEYYCDFCEERRHGNVGVYGCEECQLERKLVAHIECALSWAKQQKGCSGYVRQKMRLTQEINDLEKQLCAAEAQVQAKKEELEVAKKELVDLDALGEEYKGSCYSRNS